MQFGRIDGASFALDAAFPLSPLQAGFLGREVKQKGLLQALLVLLNLSWLALEESLHI